MAPLREHAGLLFVLATLLPLASFTLLLLAAGVRWFLRPYQSNASVKSMYEFFGGDVTGRGPAFVATAAIMLSFICCAAGFTIYLTEDHHGPAHAAHAGHDKHDVEKHNGDKHDEKEKAKKDEHHNPKWADSVVWAKLNFTGTPLQATELRVGYYIDTLSGLMFVMVTFIASLIHLFSIGYMSDELKKEVEDHEVHTNHGHFHRRGRFGRFFMYLSLFCFSMLNLILADNLFQIFVSWELVGVCSFLLIGFYFERQSASNAANKAFITNRIGDAGFILGVLILFTHVGSLNFEDIFKQLRSPAVDAHGEKMNNDVNRFVRGEVKNNKLTIAEEGSSVLVLPRRPHYHADADPLKVGRAVTVSSNPRPNQHGHMPYWMLVVAGLGIFLGCVGKSAQFPLHVWLPDAMEGPTPVSALIHAATMVAAGVYLVGRAYPIFTPEVLLTIAYTGGITLFVAATIAVVATDIKKVLAYSTVSQLGYMMLGLGVGGWAAGLFHLITHAVFKALLFLGSGSVIYGCHHQQDMMKMGGLFPKMKITALTMLMGVLAIAGIPLFSGWYSKDAILANSLSFFLLHKEHFLLFVLPLVTAGITTFYMFRMWFLTFTGEPRDHHVHEHTHESPWMMTLPLILLGTLSVCVAWGWPLWDAEASALEHQIHHSQPAAVEADWTARIERSGVHVHEEEGKTPYQSWLAHNHHLAGNLALGVVAIGLLFAFSGYYLRILDPNESKENFPGVFRFLWNKWYFDEVYSAILVRPGMMVARWCRWFDTNMIDGFVHRLSRVNLLFSGWSGWFDRWIVDGLVNVVGNIWYGVGNWLRTFQTGYLRSYVLFLALASIGIWAVLSLVIGAK
jgi:NADH-quinone oxidoreductase subunit L